MRSTQAADEREGTTPLHRTAYGGHLATAEALLAGGANIEAPSLRNSSTPLHLAAKAGRADMCALLVRHGAAMTLRNRRGDVPIAMTSDNATLRTLLDPGLFRAGVYATDPALALSGSASTSDGASTSSSVGATSTDGVCWAMDDLSLSHDAAEAAVPGSYGTGEGPFRGLGAEASNLFERALEQARKNMDVNLGIFPFDLLSHDERIVTLSRVATAVHGYGVCPRDNVTESALYAIYASARERVQAEADDGKPIDASSWRRLLLDAYEAEVGTAALRGLDISGALRVKKECWAVMADQVAASASFGHELFWTLWQIFRERDPFTQRLLYSRLGAAESYFGPRPAAVTDTDISDAERKIAALTPKGQAAMSGVFPPDHFASAMTMRQLVFSVEGGAGPPGCMCEYCQRCRQVLTGSKASTKGRSKGKRGGARGKSTGIEGLAMAAGGNDMCTEMMLDDPKGSKASGGSGRKDGKGAKHGAESGGAGAYGNGADKPLCPDDMWKLTDAAWGAIAQQQDDVLKWFTCLSPSQRRAALTLPERELDRSMASSADWDVLTTAEMDYDYGTSGAGPEGALIEYDEASGCFTPGSALLKPDQAVPAMVHSLDPQKVRQSQLWRDPAMLEYLDAATRRALGARVLELHFTRLFAVKLLAKFGEAAREAAAQAALESLLADEAAAKEGNQQSKKSKKKKKKGKKDTSKPTSAPEHLAAEEPPEPAAVEVETAADTAADDADADEESDGGGGAVGAFAALMGVEDEMPAAPKGAKGAKTTAPPVNATKGSGLSTTTTIDKNDQAGFQPKLTKKQRERERKEQAKREKEREAKEAAAAAASAADARRKREEEQAMARAIAESLQGASADSGRKKARALTKAQQKQQMQQTQQQQVMMQRQQMQAARNAQAARPAPQPVTARPVAAVARGPPAAQPVVRNPGISQQQRPPTSMAPSSGYAAPKAPSTPPYVAHKGSSQPAKVPNGQSAGGAFAPPARAMAQQGSPPQVQTRYAPATTAGAPGTFVRGGGAGSADQQQYGMFGGWGKGGNVGTATPPQAAQPGWSSAGSLPGLDLGAGLGAFGGGGGGGGGILGPGTATAAGTSMFDSLMGSKPGGEPPAPMQSAFGVGPPSGGFGALGVGGTGYGGLQQQAPAQPASGMFGQPLGQPAGAATPASQWGGPALTGQGVGAAPANGAAPADGGYDESLLPASIIG